MPDGLPTVDDVAMLMLARTKTRGAGEAGTFTDATRPTAAQAAQQIALSAQELYGSAAIGPWVDMPAVVQPKAERVVARLAAANIELTYWPEQTTTRTGQSPYQSHMERFRELREELVAALADARTDGTLDGSGGAGHALLPRANFPENQGGLVGWGTDW